MKFRVACVVVGFLSLSVSLAQLTVAQTTTETASALPRLIRFGGTVKDLNGNLLTGVVGITFALYSEQTGGAALWLETQNVTADSNGRYVAVLGSTKLDGVPTDLFTTEQARWVGVQVSGQAEQPRVLLVSAPYALKAGDAETLGGKPASAYALATPQTATSAPASESAKPSAAVNASTNNQSSIQAAIAGSGTTNYIPLWTSSTALGNSNIFQNATNKDIGIGTAKPTATLDVKGNVVFTGNLSDTGNITSTGAITGKTGSFSGNLTATGVVTGSSYQIGSNLFAFGSYAKQNAFLGFAGNSTTTGTGNTGVGFLALSSNPTGLSNTAIGSYALRSTSAGNLNTALGTGALLGLVSGSGNTEVGGRGEEPGFNGSNNTFLGAGSGAGGNTTLNGTTAIGVSAIVGASNSVTNATAIGANAQVTANNAMVLGSISGVNGATASTNVGIGTTAPTHTLEVNSAGATTAQMAMITDGTDAAFSLNNTANGGREYWIDSGSGAAGVGAGNFAIYDRTIGSPRLVVSPAGNVGIGTISPDNPLSVMGSADKTGGGSWGTFSDGRLKNLNGSFSSGLSQVLKIHPVRYRYKADNPLGIRDTDEHIGVVAQEVRQVIPEAVTENSKGYLMVNNDPIIWSMLNAIKEQQREIQQQQAALRTQATAIRVMRSELRATGQTLQKVKAQVAVAQPALVAAK